jgi:hypothetical protein
MKDKLYIINRDFEELDYDVRAYKISDYELHIST